MAKLSLHEEYWPFTQDLVWRLVTSESFLGKGKLDDNAIRAMCALAFKVASIYYPERAIELGRLQNEADEAEKARIQVQADEAKKAREAAAAAEAKAAADQAKANEAKKVVANNRPKLPSKPAGKASKPATPAAKEKRSKR